MSSQGKHDPDTEHLPIGMLRPIRPSKDRSIVFRFNAAEASRRNNLQYFEMFCDIGAAKPTRFGGHIKWARIGSG
jgi:hypothetical protein